MIKKVLLIFLCILCLGGISLGIFNAVENRTIVKEYGKLDDGVFDKNDPQHITKKFGRYDGYVAVFFYKEVDRSDLHPIEDTNTLYFYSSVGQFYFYKDGEFYTMDEVTLKISDKSKYLVNYRFDVYRYIQYVYFGKEM